MLRIGLVAMMSVAALFFAGCDDTSSKEAKEYDRQKALNDKDYDKVLRLTQNCGGADYSCQMDRAAAYAGKAGFTLSSTITGLTSEGGGDEFYAKLAKNATASARESLDSAKGAYEGIIEVGSKNKDNVCNKNHADYTSAGYYQKASCFPHGMTVMAKTAVLMNALKTGTNMPTDAGDVADLLNNDIGTLVNLFGGGDAETVSAVNEIKDDICIAASKPAGCTLVDTDITAYLATH